MIARLAFLTLVIVSLIGCSGGASTEPSPTATPQDPITWTGVDSGYTSTTPAE